MHLFPTEALVSFLPPMASLFKEPFMGSSGSYKIFSPYLSDTSEQVSNSAISTKLVGQNSNSASMKLQISRGGGA